MKNPFEHSYRFSDKVRDAVDDLKVGESAPFNLDGEVRAKLSGTLSGYCVKGKFKTKQDPTDPGIIWIQRVED